MAKRLNETAGERSKSNVDSALISQYMREATVAKRELDEKQGSYRSVLKRAKGAGIETKALIAAMNAKKLDDDDVIRDLRNTIRYYSIAGIGVSKSGLFDDLDIAVADDVKEDQGQWAAEEAGYEAGKSNGAREDNPFPPGAPTHAKWDKGWRRGKQVLAGQPADAAKPASTRRGKNRPTEDEGAPPTNVTKLH